MLVSLFLNEWDFDLNFKHKLISLFRNSNICNKSYFDGFLKGLTFFISEFHEIRSKKVVPVLNSSFPKLETDEEMRSYY